MTRRYLEIPEQLNLGAWVVDRHVHEGRGHRVAARLDDRTYTYDDLRRLSNRAGHALRALGVRRGDRVLLRLGTNLDCLLAFIGTMKIGAVAMPTSPLLQETELRAILRNSEATLAVVTPELAAPLETLRRVLAPYKTPHEVEFVTELPKTLTGKVLRRQLRHQAGAERSERTRAV